VDLRSGEPDFANAADDRIEQHRRLTDPARQRRAIDVDALRGHHLGLAVKREVMIELRDDHMGQRAECRLPTGNGLYRRRSLHDPVARATAILGPDGANDAPLDGHGIEHLVAVLSERPQCTTAVGACAVALLGLHPLFGARQVIGQ
jgi:hypothetical protein